MESGEKMEAFRGRLSMNTSLKNANIFDEEAWMEVEGVEIKKEKKDVAVEEGDISEKDENKKNIKKIKTEKITNIKTETDSIKEETKIKVEQVKDDSDQCCTTIRRRKIKKELEDGEISEESFIGETTISEEKMQITKGKHFKIRKDLYNEEECSQDDGILNSLNNFALVTPVKNETDETEHDSKNLKNIKRTIFTRNSPYKKEETLDSTNSKRTIFTRNSPFKKEVELDTRNKTAEGKLPVFNRLGPKVPKKRFNSGSEEQSSRNSSESDKAPLKYRLGPAPAKKKRTKEMESDVEVLSRRQKQIDYGKNTIGYDNYVKAVPRTDRTSKCPKTPDKFQKYSRRAWDGLIKQWRLQLHKYDPEEAENGEDRKDNN